jgi:hypothetical protein
MAENMHESSEHIKNINAIREGLKDVEEGKTLSIHEFESEMQKRHKSLQRREMPNLVIH